jgi:hypothetical protein
MSEWRHNANLSQWELGYFDLPTERFVVHAVVTDEHIKRTIPEMTAAHLYRRLGTVPPPLSDYPPPPEPPIVYASWEAED